VSGAVIDWGETWDNGTAILSGRNCPDFISTAARNHLALLQANVSRLAA